MSREESANAVDPFDENPFSTRFVRPGAVDYVFPADCDANQLVEVFHRQDASGEIVGPHGSGKTTLLAALLPKLVARGWSVQRYDLHDEQRALPAGWLKAAVSAPHALVVIDGYEQLSRWRQFRLRAACRRHGCGLLVTAHQSVGLPRLWTTDVDADRAIAVFFQLVPEPSELVAFADLEACLSRCPTDLRAALFELYDVYERRRRLPPHAE